MQKSKNRRGSNTDLLDQKLHEAAVESLEKRIMELALRRTDSQDGALFVWDKKAKGLAIDFHVAGGLFINLPDKVLHRRDDGRPNGIAMWVLDHNEPYLCNDTSQDPHYAAYFQDVLSIAAVPIPYQGRAIGVLTVSSPKRDAYVEAHIDELEALAASATKFLRRAQLFRTKRREGGRFLLIKGLSPEWLEVEQQLERASPTEAPILVQGESGTGKELVANAIHFNSKRADKPFVVVNCAAIPEQLLESTLFGHVKGAFTGANYTKVGEFQKADGGTLFLDEVGDFPLSLQPKVLRAIEYGEVQPLGSNDPPRTVNVRLVCATNRDLVSMVQERLFREDLFYRISLITMKVPPLRSYRQTLPTMAKVFLEQAAKKHDKQVTSIDPVTLSLLDVYDFPGNVRELKNIVERAVIMTSGTQVQPEDLPPTLRATTAEPEPQVSRRPTLKELRESWLAAAETRYLTELLQECGGNVREAAQLANINMVTMYRLLKKRGLRLAKEIRGGSGP